MQYRYTVQNYLFLKCKQILVEIINNLSTMWPVVRQAVCKPKLVCSNGGFYLPIILIIASERVRTCSF